MPSGSNMNDLLKVPLVHVLTLAALSLAETPLKGLLGFCKGQGVSGNGGVGGAVAFQINTKMVCFQWSLLSF